MRHIISPTDLNLTELDELRIYLKILSRIQQNIQMHVIERSLQPYSMSPASEKTALRPPVKSRRKYLVFIKDATSIKR